MHNFTEGYLRRFSGVARLYGEAALSNFSKARICIVGLGGVGSWAAEALVRSGIGYITLIDMDDICLTNTNRQIHAIQPDIGELKTAVMARRLKQINPECRITIIDDFVSKDNITDYFSTHAETCFDYILDAIDNARDKAALIAYCKRHKLKLITVGGAGGQKDPTQIQIADLAKTIQDPLAAKVRQRLKCDYGINKNSRGKLGIPCIYSTEQLVYPQADGLGCSLKKNALGKRQMDCSSGFGAITTVTATFGFVAVSYILDKIA